MKVACIGSRDLSDVQLRFCETIGRLIVENGFELHSGNAPGADQAYARGGNQVNPEMVHLHLPWQSFRREAVVPGNHVYVYPFNALRFYVDIAAECHPKWQYLKEYARKLHTRNASILVPNQQNVDVCVAWPSSRPGGGGTGQGMRIAKSRGIRLVDLTRVRPEQVVHWLRSVR